MDNTIILVLESTPDMTNKCRVRSFLISVLLYLNMCCSLLLYSIQALLSAPNPDDPLSENIAKHWKTNEVEAVETGKSCIFDLVVIL